MKILKNNLTHPLNLRTEMDFPVEGVEFIDITPLIIQKETLKEITKLFKQEVKDKKVDYIIAPEARGFLFASSVANELNIGCLPVRKKGKLPPTTVEATVEYVKEYGKDVLELPKLIEQTYAGKNFYIIDDIYATGNTLNAIKEKITELGGKVVGEGVVMNIKELNKNKTLFSIIDIHEG